MTSFKAKSVNGRLAIERRDDFVLDLKENPGARYEIERITPESTKQRRFFEGAVVTLVAYLQEGMDHRNGDDLREVRDWLKIEFNGEIRVIGGRSNRIAKSTKGLLNKGFLEDVIDWIEEQYGLNRAKVLDHDHLF